MSAQEQVIGLPELVEHIIASMAPEDIPMASRVSKMWHEQVLRSKSVLLASCLRPKYTCMKDIKIKGVFDTISTTELMPCYDFPHRLRIHSAFYASSRNFYGDGTCYNLKLAGNFLTLWKSQDFQAFKDRHVTQPPLTQILISAYGLVKPVHCCLEVFCVVRNKQGVTAGDVLDAWHAIDTTGDWVEYSKAYVSYEACFRVWDSSRNVQPDKPLYE